VRCLILCWKRRREKGKLKREKGASWMSKGEGRLRLKRKRKKTSACAPILRGRKKRLGGEIRTTAGGGMKSNGGRRKRNGGQKICGIPKFAGGKNRVGRRRRKKREEIGTEICWSCLAWLELCQILSPALLVGAGPLLVLQALLPQLAVTRQ
jgi:hypothetical protein